MKYVIKLCLLLAFSVSVSASGVMPQGDAERGKMAFNKCRTCHYPEKAVGHNNGPSLWNIFGKVAGKQEGFEYSPVFQQATFTWTPELLYFWLGNPEMVPDSQMVFAPFATDQERADIVAFLETFKD